MNNLSKKIFYIVSKLNINNKIYKLLKLKINS